MSGTPDETNKPAEEIVSGDEATQEPSPTLDDHLSPSADAGEEDLADQLQDLLDQGQINDFVPLSPEQLQTLMDEVNAQLEPTPDHQPPDPVEPEATHQPAPLRAATSLEAIDEMLATGAEEAVGDDFETVGDVLAEEAMLAEETEAPVDPANQTPDADADDSKEDESAEGEFETPQEVLSENTTEEEAPAPPTYEAARLDTVESGQAEASETAEDTPDVDQPPAKRLRLASVKPVALQICWKLNRPLDRLSPDHRKLIGWIGLITVFNGGIMLCYGLIRRFLGS